MLHFLARMWPQKEANVLAGNGRRLGSPASSFEFPSPKTKPEGQSSQPATILPAKTGGFACIRIRQGSGLLAVFQSVTAMRMDGRAMSKAQAALETAPKPKLN